MTEHNEAKFGDIAKTVIMPGDPLRAKMIAEKYLTNYKLVNKVRNNYAYTGYYKDRLLTVMSSGMGMPSMGIYSYELFKFYDVDNIIRVGTCGAYTEELKLYDTILVENAYTDSNYALAQNNDPNNLIDADIDLNNRIKEAAANLNIPLICGTIHSSDIFYKENNNFKELKEKYGCMAVEMESFALLHNAKILGKKASCLLTVSDSLVSGDKTTSEERQNAFSNMIEIALNIV